MWEEWNGGRLENWGKNRRQKTVDSRQKREDWKIGRME
jgi:hypothetical protein